MRVVDNLHGRCRLDSADTIISYDEYYRNYVNLKKTFNPVKFNPEYWADLAKEAGMKYFVFTTKHHDGFCMWDTKETDYKITSSECPYHTAPNPDILKELFGAFQKRDFMIGAYFSKPDWNSPYYWSDRWQHGDRNVNYKIKITRGCGRSFVISRITR